VVTVAAIRRDREMAVKTKCIGLSL
jgi:hypothetical protein